MYSELIPSFFFKHTIFPEKILLKQQTFKQSHFILAMLAPPHILPNTDWTIEHSAVYGSNNSIVDHRFLVPIVDSIVDMVAKISMADAKAEFDALYKQATTEDESRLVLVIDRLKVLGKQLGMGYTRKLPFKAVIPHRRNRDGAMASSKEALNIWDDIDRVGVSLDLYKDAKCFEEP